MNYRHAICGGMIAAILLSAVPMKSHAGEEFGQDLKEIRADLERMRQQLEEQGKLIRVIYDYLDSEVDFEKAEKAKQEESVLLLETVADIVSGNLTSLGCVNPTAPEFAVITSDGGVSVYDAQGRILHKLKEPEQIITAISYSPDGMLLLAGTKAGTLLVCEAGAEQCKLIVDNLGVSIGRVAWLSGSEKVVWGSYVDYFGDGGKEINRDKPTGAVLDRASGSIFWTFQSSIRSDFQTLAGSRDGKKLAILEIPGKPRGAYILDEHTGEPAPVLYDQLHGSGPLSVCIGPDNNTVAVGYAPRDVILWNSKSGNRLKMLEGHTNWVVALDFSRDGQFLISGAGDSTARVWSVESGKEIGRIRFEGSSTYIESVGFSSDGKMVFALTKGRLIVAKMSHPQEPETQN